MSSFSKYVINALFKKVNLQMTFTIRVDAEYFHTLTNFIIYSKCNLEDNTIYIYRNLAYHKVEAFQAYLQTNIYITMKVHLVCSEY